MPRSANVTLYWRLQIAGWAGFGALNAVAAFWLGHLPVLQAVGQGAVLGGIGLALSHVLQRWVRHPRLLTRTVPVRIAWTFALSVLISIPTGIITAFAGVAPWQTADLEVNETLRWIVVLAIHVLNWTFLLLLWSTVYFVLHSIRERSRAQLRESELARALQLTQLQVLETQLNPHFLFNALNTVRALIAQDPTLAQQAVTQLARTLRYTLGSGRENLVPLERELAMVDDYLAIEGLRLADRLSLVREISPATRAVRIPVMLLQMLVENAIKHGIAELPRGGDLRISSEIDNGKLVLTVENTRPQASTSWHDPESIGLKNCAQRLELLFGPRARVSLDVTRPDRAIARVCIPCDP